MQGKIPDLVKCILKCKHLTPSLTLIYHVIYLKYPHLPLSNFSKFFVLRFSDLVMFLFQRKIEDIHVVCGLLKDFLRKLSEPLVTYDLWSAFVDAASKDCFLFSSYFGFGFLSFNPSPEYSQLQISPGH